VVGNTTTTAVNASTGFSASAQNVTLDATVTSGGAGVNEGTVTFSVMQGATLIGTPTTSAVVVAGSASVSYALPAGTAAGTYTIDAIYNSGSNYFGSSDTTHTLDVASPPPTTSVPQSTLSLSTLTGTVGTPLTLETSGGSGTGAVTYAATDGTATGCSITGSSLDTTTAGTCIVTATKAASGAYESTSSSPTTVTMSQISKTGTVTTPLPVRAIRVVGTITGGERSTVTIIGSGFYGSPRIVSNVSGFVARVEHDRGTSLTVVITVKEQAIRGVREMTLIMADGKRASVKYSLH
jgi:Big-like domain-containing protein